jgi:hypothetical protein
MWTLLWRQYKNVYMGCLVLKYVIQGYRTRIITYKLTVQSKGENDDKLHLLIRKLSEFLFILVYDEWYKIRIFIKLSVALSMSKFEMVKCYVEFVRDYSSLYT